MSELPRRTMQWLALLSLRLVAALENTYPIEGRLGLLVVEPLVDPQPVITAVTALRRVWGSNYRIDSRPELQPDDPPACTRLADALQQILDHYGWKVCSLPDSTPTPKERTRLLMPEIAGALWKPRSPPVLPVRMLTALREAANEVLGTTPATPDQVSREDIGEAAANSTDTIKDTNHPFLRRDSKEGEILQAMLLLGATPGAPVASMKEIARKAWDEEKDWRRSLTKLKEWGMVETEARGCRLTRQGAAEAKRLSEAHRARP